MVGWRVVITGASGLLGRAIAKKFLSMGWHVAAFGRTDPGISDPLFCWQPLDLTRATIADSALRGASAFIHAALVTDGASEATNVKLSRDLFVAARRANIPSRIFISSLAAAADSQSNYGREKFAIEEFMHPDNEAIVRLGLVIGDGGLYKRMVQFMRRYHVVPLFEGGRQPLQAVFADDASESLFRIAVNGLGGLFTVALPPVSYLDFYRMLARQLNVRVLFVSVPYALAEFAISVGETLQVPLPVQRESLLGLKQMRAHEAGPDLLRLALRLRPLEESIISSFRVMDRS